MLRKAGAKMTQAELGETVGVSAQQISRYEAETDEPNYATWRKLARALRMDPGELMFGIEDTPVDDLVDDPADDRKRGGGEG